MTASEYSLASARLAWAMMLGLLACGCTSATFASVASAETHLPSDGGGVVAKTVVSTKMRLVYFFGVEGSGHHYVMSAFQGMSQAHPDLPEIGQPLLSKQRYFIPFTMGKGAAAFDLARENAHRDMRDLAWRAERVSPPGTILELNGASIPTGRGRQKVMQYSDLRLMAETAEAEGIDFRVLYMKRSAKELLLANTVHRTFQNNLDMLGGTPAEAKFMEYVRILFTDIAVVQSFLAELDPAFVVCHDWKSFGDPDQAREIADAVAPNAEVASFVSEALINSSSGGLMHAVDETHPFDVANTLSSRLQQKFDSFEEAYCGRTTH